MFAHRRCESHFFIFFKQPELITEDSKEKLPECCSVEGSAQGKNVLYVQSDALALKKGQYLLNGIEGS